MVAPGWLLRRESEGMNVQSSVDGGALARRVWVVRIGALTLLFLGGAAALAVATGVDAGALAAPAVLILASAPVAWGLVHRRPGPAIAVALSVAVIALALAHFVAIGAAPTPAVLAFVPLIAVAAAGLSPLAAFLTADGVVLVWALLAGLSAAALPSLVPNALHGPDRTLLDLGLLAGFLNHIFVLLSDL